MKISVITTLFYGEKYISDLIKCIEDNINVISNESEDIQVEYVFINDSPEQQIKDISSDELIEKLNNGGLTFYIGTDPTADSLHIGHFSSFLISKRLKNAGHNPILLVVVGTGLIGDPRHTSERTIITK